MKFPPIPFFLGLCLIFGTPILAGDPAWWTTRGVTTAAAPSNLSPAMIGQAKHIVSQALAELRTKLSDPEFRILETEVKAVMALTAPQSPAESEALRGILKIGQLKAIAKPFYDRLRLIDAPWLDAQMTAAATRIPIAGSSPVVFHPYPWTTTTTPENHSPANLGQLKAVFALSFLDWRTAFVDTDQDGLNDHWERLHFTNLDQNGLPDSDGDGYTNAQESAMASNPLVAEVDINTHGLPDAWETAQAGKFSAFPPLAVASLNWNTTRSSPIILKNDTDTPVDYTLNHTGNINPAYCYETSFQSAADVQLFWDNISATGTLLSAISDADDASQAVAFTGFTFPFYGTNYSEVHVSSNGVLTFGTGFSSGVTKPIPGALAPPAMITPWWTNFNPAVSGDIYYQLRSDRLIIQYQNMRKSHHGGDDQHNTFQAVLHSNGEIYFYHFTFLYRHTDPLNPSVTGIQDPTKQFGFQIPMKQWFLGHDTAVRITPCSEFHTVSPPLVKSVPPRTTVTIPGSLRAFVMPYADYQSEVQVIQVGSSLPPLSLKTKLSVVDAPTEVVLTTPIATSNSVLVGETVVLTTSANDNDGIDKILFFDGDTLIKETSDRYITYAATASIPGNRLFTVVVIDIYGNRTTSRPVQFNVLADSDSDAMSDLWETSHNLDLQTNDSGNDPDHDGFTNLEEYKNSTNPRVANPSPDSDSDGMPDNWEFRHGLYVNYNDSTENRDGDLLADRTPFTNLMEFQADTSPILPDTDTDGMPDGWEVSYSLNPRKNDSALNPDSDTHSNLVEYKNRTNPLIPDPPDTDLDGLLDPWETTHNLDPQTYDSDRDPDHDGFTNLEEYQNGTNPRVADLSGDSDSDGMPDIWEIRHKLDPYQNDSALDPDKDELTNLKEFQIDTNPKEPDTDGGRIQTVSEYIVGNSFCLVGCMF